MTERNLLPAFLCLSVFLLFVCRLRRVTGHKAMNRFFSDSEAKVTVANHSTCRVISYVIS